MEILAGRRKMSRKLSSFVIVSGLVLLMASFAIAKVSAFPEDTLREKTFTTYYGTPLGTPGTWTYNVYG